MINTARCTLQVGRLRIEGIEWDRVWRLVSSQRMDPFGWSVLCDAGGTGEIFRRAVTGEWVKFEK